MTSKIVAVVPAYNASSTIGRCVDALLTDGFEPSDIVVINDGSADETYEIAEARGVCVLRNGRPLGPAAARNAGVAVVTTPIWNTEDGATSAKAI